VYHRPMKHAEEFAGDEVGSAAGAAVGMGGAATAAAVSACCAGPALGPLVVAIFGVGGAVGLEGLRPYTTPLLVASGLAIGASFWLNARSTKRCTADRASMPVRVVRRALPWASVVVWLVAVVAVVWAHLA
jgi:hypothetical protein